MLCARQVCDPIVHVDPSVDPNYMTESVHVWLNSCINGPVQATVIQTDDNLKWVGVYRREYCAPHCRRVTDTVDRLTKIPDILPNIRVSANVKRVKRLTHMRKSPSDEAVTQ